MSEIPEDLNYDFNYNLFLAKATMSYLTKPEDQSKVVRWLNKLSSCNRSIAEMKLRNDFMYFLVINMQSGELQPPFTDNPPQTPLPKLSHFLPGGSQGPDTRQIPEANKKPLLYENSPDGGAFLAAQPIPRCGAFCYLAVVAKNQHE